MPVDNSIYETLADWWDPTGSVAGIHAMNPVRAGYFLAVLERITDGSRLPLLDLGCGGGLLGEELARAGFPVVGADQAMGALRIATAHARAGGLPARFVRARAASLPFPDRSFAAVLASDLLEHLDDLAPALGECARILRPGGAFLYDTINRTWATRLVHIGLLQRWKRLVPADTHDFRRFVRPEELERALRSAGLEPVETLGLYPRHRLRFVLRLLAHRRGRDRMGAFRLGPWTATSYVGHARRRT